MGNEKQDDPKVNGNSTTPAAAKKEQGNSPSVQNSPSPPSTSADAPTFSPHDISQSPPIFSLPEPNSQWVSMLASPCSFEPEYFQRVMQNLIYKPDIASTYLFRAEIFYDSFKDPESTFLQHVRAEYQPQYCAVPGYELQQTVVRRFVPRNPQRDASLVQTCHVYRNFERSGSGEAGDGEEKNLVLYIPHAASPEDVPYYHPTVQRLAFLHTWSTSPPTSSQPQGTVSIHYDLFPTHPLTPRLSRTALSLITLVNKHSLGQKTGYTKRVHHDLLVPQARFQDTYTRLKTKYAKRLIEGWVEQTPPGKHVFEDLGIAAFLMELWKGLYRGLGAAEDQDEEKKPEFPGFVDIGCGNGVLVYVLSEEGFQGWGFDARARKTWDTFPASIQERLKEMVLVPAVLQAAASPAAPDNEDSNGTGAAIAPPTKETQTRIQTKIHTGVFPPSTFIISNHADELTPWTPLLASLSRSPFIAIPCCSHSFTGAKFRAPVQRRDAKHPTRIEGPDSGNGSKGEKTGSLARKDKQPSAYATLCDWVHRIAKDVGYVPEKEMLRIPSTRNAGIVGRRWREEEDEVEHWEDALESRMRAVRKVLMRELGGSVEREGGLEDVGREWCERAEKLVKGQAGGH